MDKATLAIVLVCTLHLFAPYVAAACPRDCFKCGTTSVSCYIRSPFVDMDLLPPRVQNLTITCLPGGKINSLEPLSRLHNLLDLKITGCFQGMLRGSTFSSLSSLKLLNISNNDIVELSEDSLKYLSNLDTLDMSNNIIGLVPDSFFSHSPKLEKLYLDGNKLNNLPSKDLTNLLFLDYLSLSRNQFTTLRGVFANLKRLTRLDIGHNQLTTLSDGDFNVPNLQYLNVQHNSIHTIDKKALEKSALVTLIMADNILTTADPISFPHVTSLDLSNNRIQTLPPSFGNFLSSVHDIKLSGNPFHCNCELEHLRTFYSAHPSQTDGMKCRTPMTIDFKDAKTPFNCMPPAVSLSRVAKGILCEVRGDPTPSVDWLDFKSGEILVTSAPPADASITSHAVLIGKNFLHNYNEVMCRSQNRYNVASEKCYVFDFTNNVTAASSNQRSEEGTIRKSVFIGSLVGVFVGAVCLVTYVIICVKYSKCICQTRDEKKQKGLRPYYAQPKTPRRRTHKMTPRPWEFPPHFPNPFGPRQQTADDNIYATIDENHNRFKRANPTNQFNNSSVTIEELHPSDDEDVKHPIQDSPEMGNTLRIMELTGADDTPNTSSTTLPTSTPSQSVNPLPLTTIDPDRIIMPETYSKSGSIPDEHPPSLSSYSDLPNIFAANRRMSDRLGIRSTPVSKRPSVMVLGDVTGIPGFSRFDGIQMEQTPSLEYGYELEV